jgi:hypothetical protein
MKNIQSIDFSVGKEEFISFMDKMKEMNRISEYHKIKWLGDKVLLYTVEGEHNKVNKVRAYLMNREELFRQFPHDLDITYTMMDTKNWIKQFAFLTEDKSDSYNFTLDYQDTNNTALSLTASNSELELRSVAGDESEVKDLTLDTFSERLNPLFADWKAPLTQEQLDKMRKLSKLNNDTTIEVIVRDGVLYMRQNNWKIKVSENVDCGDSDWIFNKKSLDIISKSKECVDFCMFPSLILIDEGDSIAIFTLELLA